MVWNICTVKNFKANLWHIDSYVCDLDSEVIDMGEGIAEQNFGLMSIIIPILN